MKKALSVLLCVLAIFSMFSFMTFAQDGTADSTPITVKFMDGESVIKTIQVKEGAILTPFCPMNPEKPSTETTKYTFRGWVAYNEDGTVADETIYNSETLPAPYLEEGEETKTIIYKAQYIEKDITGNITFWGLIQSIFERLNRLFEYFAEVFGF